MTRWLRLLCSSVVASCLLAACGPDETLELFPGGGGAGAGGSGGSGTGCSLHDDCSGTDPWCDVTNASCTPCPAGLEQCGSECADTSRDPRHCGGCFGPCSVGEVCREGTCACAVGLERCSGSCVDTTSEPAHCGACDHPCDPGHACIDSACHASGCNAPLSACDDGTGKLACVDLAHGPRCGSCDVVCGPHEVCVEGACTEHVPATPCTTCPCADVCHAAFGANATCCEGIGGEPGVSCVAGATCP